MRKIVILFIALLIVCAPSFGSGTIKVGFKGGVDLANISINGGNESHNISYKVKPGFVAGLTGEVDFGPRGLFAVRGEMLYVQKGAKFTILNESGRFSTDEIVVAPFFVARWVTPAITPFLEVGPEVGFNMLAKEKQGSTTHDISTQWKKENVSLNVGGGVEIPIGQNELSVDARYNLGLVNMSKTNDTSKLKTNGIQILLGFVFLRF